MSKGNTYKAWCLKKYPGAYCIKMKHHFYVWLDKNVDQYFSALSANEAWGKAWAEIG